MILVMKRIQMGDEKRKMQIEFVSLVVN